MMAASPRSIEGIHRVLVSAPQLRRRVKELGAQITKDYAGRTPVLIGVLKGVACFMADLMRQISLPVAIDFMAISSFDNVNGGYVRILKDLDESIDGRDVLLVQDIVDTGDAGPLPAYLRAPGTLKVCTLLDSAARRRAAGLRRQDADGSSSATVGLRAVVPQSGVIATLSRDGRATVPPLAESRAVAVLPSSPGVRQCTIPDMTQAPNSKRGPQRPCSFCRAPLLIVHTAYWRERPAGDLFEQRTLSPSLQPGSRPRHRTLVALLIRA
jgi:hypoxanthine phosphoribosyltransferase